MYVVPSRKRIEGDPPLRFCTAMRVWSAFQGCCFEYAWRASAPQVPATGNVGAPVSPVMRVIVVPMSGSTIGTRVSGRGTIGTGYTATGSVSGMALDEA